MDMMSTDLYMARADGSDYQNILDDDSLYIRICRLYYEANQMGLIDPDSPRQQYEDCFNKYREGRVLFSFWSWLGQPAYNTSEHTVQGRGFMLAPIQVCRSIPMDVIMKATSRM